MSDDPNAFGASGVGEDALLDQTLRDLLTHLPDGAEPANLPPGALAAIEHAVARGWPDGQPPTAEQIAREDAGSDPNDATWSDDHQHQPWHADTHHHYDSPDHTGHHGAGHTYHHPDDHSGDGHHFDGGHF